jgi:LacI family transcriptional regulator
VNVSGDNRTGMAELARHLVRNHGYRRLAYLDGHADSPDNLARKDAFGEQMTADGAEFISGPQWQGSYTASGGARVIERLLASGDSLPQAIACANDQTALGVVYALMRYGIRRARRSRRHRLRRHSRGAPPPPATDHRPPADH